MKLHIGDEIVVTAGKDKGRKGKIEKVFPFNSRVLVPGLNVFKKHQKGMGRQRGGIFEFARPLSLGNVALVCPHCNKPTRVGMKRTNSEKVRICKKCGRVIDELSKKEKNT